MKEYSLQNSDFKKISLAQIKVLFEVLMNSHGHDISYVKEKYLRGSAFFDETFRFLSVLGIVENIDKQLQLSIPANMEVESILLNSLFRKASKISAIVDYFHNFLLVEDVYTFKPPVQKNLQTSGVRNLLLELDIIEHDISTGNYIVSKKGTPYLKSFLYRTSVLEFEEILRKRDKLGLKAELAVLAYEHKKLSKYPGLAKQIVHVSRSDVGAGYDIQSFTYADGAPTLKYIEVKAVSANDFSFFWSINEIEVAKWYRQQYYLYLVPISKGGKINMQKLKIISDPYDYIYKDEKNRDLESVLFHVSPK
ncbi:MAG: DUF3883 domain-containing protein [Minisyncoccia bacterium]